MMGLEAIRTELKSTEISFTKYEDRPENINAFICSA